MKKLPRLISLSAGLAVFLSTACTTPDNWRKSHIEADPFAESAAEGSVQSEEEPPVLSEPVEKKVPTDPLPIAREDAVMMALGQNPDLRIQQLNPLIAGGFEAIERGRFDPEIFANYQYAEESASETDRATQQRISFEGESHRGTVGVRQRLPTGTDVEASFRQDRSISDRSPEHQSARVGLTVTQQLLRGFGPAVNFAAIRQAELDTVASEFELRGYVEALVADVEIAYWNYVLAEKRIAIFEQSHEVAVRQLNEIRERVEVGALSRNELAAASAETAMREQDLINARSLLEERRLRLLLLLSPDYENWHELELTATSPLDSAPAPTGDLNERIALALQSRPDLNEAKLRLQRDELEVIVTRNGLLPRLELFATLGRSGYADTFLDSIKRIDGSDYDLTVGVSLTHAIGNRAAKGRGLIARGRYRQSVEAIENLRDLIRFDVASAKNEVERSRQQIAASSETRAFREQTAQAEQDRFLVGTSTALDVALAQRDLLASQIDEVEARVEFQIAQIELFLAEGTLLERRGLAIPATFEPPAL